MIECFHPDCDRVFDSKQGRGCHFTYHEDYKDVAIELLSKEDSVTYDNCSEKVGLTSAFYENNFGSWNNALELAGIEKRLERNIPDKKLLKELHRLADEDGRVLYRDMNSDGKYSSKLYEQRFGSWDNALEKADLNTQNQNGENNPCWRGGVTSLNYVCEYCGSTFESRHDRVNKFCDESCKASWLSENMCGEDNPNWMGGKIKSRYTAPFNKNREIVMERDGCCVICGESENLHCHHIKPVRDFVKDDDSNVRDAHRVENMVILCNKHHPMYEGKYKEHTATEFKSEALSQ